MWVRMEDLTPVEVTHDSHLDRLSAMRAHPKLKHKYVSNLCATCTCQSYGAGSPAAEGKGGCDGDVSVGVFSGSICSS